MPQAVALDDRTARLVEILEGHELVFFSCLNDDRLPDVICQLEAAGQDYACIPAAPKSKHGWLLLTSVLVTRPPMLMTCRAIRPIVGPLLAAGQTRRMKLSEGWAAQCLRALPGG